MPLVKYTANLSPRNGTGRIRLESSAEGVIREIALGGPAVDLSDDEFNSLRGRYQFEKVDEEQAGQTVPDALVGRPFDLTTVAPVTDQPVSVPEPQAAADATPDPESPTTDHSAEGEGQEEHF